MGTFVSLAIGIFTGLVVGIVYYFTVSLHTHQVFSDAVFAEIGP